MFQEIPRPVKPVICRDCGRMIGRKVHERGVVWRLEKGRGFGGHFANAYYCADDLPANESQIRGYWE